MANRELVIKVPEELLEYFANHNCMNEDGWFSHSSTLLDAFRNATPLPKGHGELKDANNLKHAFISWSMAVQGFFTDADIASIIYNSPTIVEADTESEDQG